MLDGDRWPTGFDLYDPIRSPEPQWTRPLRRPPSKIPAVTIPKESQRFRQHFTRVRSVGRGVLHENQVAVKDCLKKDTNRLALMEIRLFGSEHGDYRRLLMCRLGMKDIAGRLLKADELLCFCHEFAQR